MHKNIGLNKLIKSTVFFGVMLIIWLGLGVSSSFALEGYETESFDVQIKANENNTFDVTETIKVNFLEERHGIYRDIPYVHGRVVVKNISVEGDKFDISNENEGDSYLTRIIIGDEDKVLIGEKTYRIHYTLVGAKDKVSLADYLYVDLLPNFWESSIKNAKISMTLPKPIDWSSAEFHSGKYGERGLSDNFKVVADDKELEISARNVGRGEGLTVFAILEEGYWQGIEDRSYAFKILTAILIAIPLILGVLWFIFGRDKAIVKQVEFYPPEGLSPLDIGMILDGTVQKKDFVALIPYLANKGYIKIEDTEEKGSVLTLLDTIEIIESKEPPEIALFVETLFPRGKTVFCTGDLNENQSVKDSLAREKSYELANDEIEYKYGGYNSVYKKSSKIAAGIGGALVFLIPVLTILFTGVYLGSHLNAEWNFYSISILMGTLIGLRIQTQKYDMGKAMKVFLSISSWGFVLAGLYGMYRLMELYFMVEYLPIIVVAYLVSAIFEVHMLSRTKINGEYMGRILGFKEFIKVAELDRINMLVKENPNYFFDILPYAYVFNLTDKWIKNFESIKLEEPDWYHSDYGRDFSSGFSASGFVNNIASFDSAVSSFEPASSGSGSSGGSSGGGMGGGGGGSW